MADAGKAYEEAILCCAVGDSKPQYSVCDHNIDRPLFANYILYPCSRSLVAPRLNSRLSYGEVDSCDKEGSAGLRFDVAKDGFVVIEQSWSTGPVRSKFESCANQVAYPQSTHGNPSMRV